MRRCGRPARRAAGLRQSDAAGLPIVAASRNDPLGCYERVADLARAWGSRLDDLGEVGHLNPASGFGPWPGAEHYVAALSAAGAETWSEST
jgi:uncharacterized protein